MTADSQDVRALLLEQDDEYRQLARRHQELDRRLGELSSKPYPSQSEQLEIATLKKRKLRLKDQMETIARRHRQQASAAPDR